MSKSTIEGLTLAFLVHGVFRNKTENIAESVDVHRQNIGLSQNLGESVSICIRIARERNGLNERLRTTK